MTQQTNQDEDNEQGKLKSVRRAKRRDSQARSSARSRRGRERHLSVRGELRETPDVRKIARAVIAMALAQAEADAQADAVTDDNAPTLPNQVDGPGERAREDGDV